MNDLILAWGSIRDMHSANLTIHPRVGHVNKGSVNLYNNVNNKESIRDKSSTSYLPITNILVQGIW